MISKLVLSSPRETQEHTLQFHFRLSAAAGHHGQTPVWHVYDLHRATDHPGAPGPEGTAWNQRHLGGDQQRTSGKPEKGVPRAPGVFGTKIRGHRQRLANDPQGCPGFRIGGYPHLRTDRSPRPADRQNSRSTETAKKERQKITPVARGYQEASSRSFVVSLFLIFLLFPSLLWFYLAWYKLSIIIWGNKEAEYL